MVYTFTYYLYEWKCVQCLAIHQVKCDSFTIAKRIPKNPKMLNVNIQQVYLIIEDRTRTRDTKRIHMSKWECVFEEYTYSHNIAFQWYVNITLAIANKIKHFRFLIFLSYYVSVFLLHLLHPRSVCVCGFIFDFHSINLHSWPPNNRQNVVNIELKYPLTNRNDNKMTTIIKSVYFSQILDMLMLAVVLLRMCVCVLSGGRFLFASAFSVRYICVTWKSEKKTASERIWNF